MVERITPEEFFALRARKGGIRSPMLQAIADLEIDSGISADCSYTHDRRGLCNGHAAIRSYLKRNKLSMKITISCNDKKLYVLRTA